LAPLKLNKIKIVSVLQRLHGKSSAQTLTFKSVMNKQTDKKLNVLPSPTEGEIRAPPNLARWYRTPSMFLHLENVSGSNA